MPAPEAELETVAAEPVVAEPVIAELPVAEAERLLEEVVALDAEMAEDDALLDLIAREMAAPQLQDEIEADFASADVETPVFAPAAEAVSPAIASPEPVVMSAAPPTMAAAPAQPVSIGAAVLASGIVAPAPSSNAALTPFRRMSQAEKIAFFY